MAQGDSAVVLGSGITTLAVVRCLARAGVPSSAVCPKGDIVTRSRWYRALDAGSNSRVRPTVASTLASLADHPGVIFPCDDNWALAVAHLRELHTGLRAAIPSLSALERLVDKEMFRELLEQLALPHPRTRPLSAHERNGQKPLPPDWFYKPTNSQAFNVRFGRKALSAGPENSAVARMALGEGLDFVAQEYIPGEARAIVLLDGYVDTRGDLQGCIARQRLRAYREPFGNSTLSETIALNDTGNALPDLLRLFREIEFTGLFNAEYKYDSRDDMFKVIEINARPWWQMALARDVGIDLCLAAYRDQLDLPFHLPSSYPLGRRCVDPIPDLAAWFCAPSLPTKETPLPLFGWRGATSSVFCKDDPLPGLAEVARGARSQVRRFRDRVHRDASSSAPIGVRMIDE